MRVIFFCGDGSRYGMAHLEPMLNSDFEVAAVVFATGERWAKFRQALSGKKYFNLNHRSVFAYLKRIIPAIKHRSTVRRERKAIEQMIKAHNVPLWFAFDVNSEAFIKKAKQLEPDLVISAAYPQIFSKDLLEIAGNCAVNFHPSLLPKFRGAHPHFWTIVAGEEESGVSAHVMTEEIDDGDLVAQRAFDIKGFTYAALYDRIVAETPVLVQDVCDFFLKGTGTLKPQDPTQISLYRNNRTIHSRIFWDVLTAEQIANLIRTGTAFFFFRNEKVLLMQGMARSKNRNMTNDIEVPAGSIVDVRNDGVVVKSKAGYVHIDRIKYRNKEYTFDKWTKRYRINIGEILQ